MPQNKFSIVFIVNGVDVPVDVNLNAPIKTGRNKALELSNNTGRPPEEWEIHDDAGQPLDPNKKAGQLGLKDGDRLFLNLKVGAGGG